MRVPKSSLLPMTFTKGERCEAEYHTKYFKTPTWPPVIVERVRQTAGENFYDVKNEKGWVLARCPRVTA